MRKKALLVMSHGGHTKEMRMLDEKLKYNIETCYLILKEDQITPQKIVGEVYRIFGARTKKSGLIHDIFGTLTMIFQSLWILLKSRPDAIISCGTSSAVPISYLGKLLRKKIIFFEIRARVYTLSVSGRMIYPIADQFFVQWEYLKERYPDTIYAGRLD